MRKWILWLSLLLALLVLFTIVINSRKEDTVEAPTDQPSETNTEIEPTQAPSQVKPTPTSSPQPQNQPAQPNQTSQPSQSQSTTVVNEQPDPTPQPTEPGVSVDIPLPSINLQSVLDGIIN